MFDFLANNSTVLLILKNKIDRVDKQVLQMSLLFTFELEYSARINFI